LLSRELTDVARSVPVNRSDDRALADSVTALLAGRPDSSAPLAASAIGILGLSQDAEPETARALDAIDGLTRLMSRDGWDYWRAAAPGPQDQRPVAPARLTLETAASHALIPVTGQHGATNATIPATPEAILVVAEPKRWSSHALVEIDGRRLNPERSAGLPTYVLPPTGGELSITLPSTYPGWRVGQLLLAAAVLFLAVPFGTRSSRRPT